MSLVPLQAAPALIDQVHDRLLAAIVDGTLAPGERLTQESVAEMLGVSRQPVSHALQILKRRGLLIEHGKRGLMVAPVEAQRVRDLYQVREALDGLAAGLAARRVQGRTDRRRREARGGQGAGRRAGPRRRGQHRCIGDGRRRLPLRDPPPVGQCRHRRDGAGRVAALHALDGPGAGRRGHAPARVARACRDPGRHLGGAAAQAEQLARSHTRRAGEETASRLEEKRSVA